MVERRLPPAEEARVRTAALVAAQRMNWTAPRAVLDYIVATSDARQSPAALEARAAGIVEYVRNHPDRPDFANVTDREAQSFFRTIHGQVVHLFGGLPYVLASRDEAASGSETSARFDSLPATNWDSPAGQAQMRNYARQCGVGWAGDHPELLRLGPAAIEALRDAHFRRESFNRLREAGFEGREAARMAVGISRYAIHHGLDANRIAEETARGVEVFGGDSPEARAMWRDRFNRFFANPADEETRRDMDRALNDVETRGTAAQREHVSRLRPLLGLERQERTVQLTTEAGDAAARAAREARERAEAAERAAREEAAAKEAALLAEALGEAPAKKGPATVAHEASAKKEPTPVQEGTAKKDAAAEAPPIKLATRSP